MKTDENTPLRLVKDDFVPYETRNVMYNRGVSDALEAIDEIRKSLSVFEQQKGCDRPLRRARAILIELLRPEE